MIYDNFDYGCFLSIKNVLFSINKYRQRRWGITNEFYFVLKYFNWHIMYCLLRLLSALFIICVFVNLNWETTFVFVDETKAFVTDLKRLDMCSYNHPQEKGKTILFICPISSSKTRTLVKEICLQLFLNLFLYRWDDSRLVF